MADDKVGSLEDEALKRKERLQALKRKITDENKEQGKSEGSTLPKPKFRSYKPQDDSLREQVLDEAKPGDVESEVKDQLSAANSKVVIEELDISSLAPRKPDWDLKRDVAKKLEKLERRTQKAIAELIRERLKQGQENLASIVNMAPINSSKLIAKAKPNEEE
ncbi:coiled-coil domain-containing protein 12 [Neodiprion pinetum]|uniref:coiled-coil domain-containing protein 12 n=1 Tax=Neodiprion fabricii TaxID=2872261 RepID=UPI00076FB990|nr:coiled-coil domain-containing protein 12 [Neodiprion fabricii]XP_046471520.1 coiled-coil domain-containing protein 12 [Neodiprion pinetum]XP_046609305.1 coiled-coil domain-containing protein 12 [Neodiprion virginianus]